MRMSRIRNDREPCYYHVINRVTGHPNALYFDTQEKEYLFHLFVRLQSFYTVEIISVAVMSNHLHAVCCTHPELPDAETVKARYRAFYGSEKVEPDWSDQQLIDHYAARMRDLSCFMKDLQQRFSTWYNKRTGRLGRLWMDRFKSVVLDGDKALWECVKYVEMNPFRAHLCEDPGDYRFTTWGRYCGSGRHPFEEAFLRHLGSFLLNRDHERDPSFTAAADEFRGELARVCTGERGGTSEEIQAAEQAGRQGVPFRLTLTRRVRYWSDGAIIGSRDFVEKFSRQVFGNEQKADRSFQIATDGGLVSFRRLRQPQPG